MINVQMLSAIFSIS